MTIWRMRIACWIPKTTNPSSQYLIIISFPLQQWLHERPSMLRYMYIACFVETFSCQIASIYSLLWMYTLRIMTSFKYGLYFCWILLAYVSLVLDLGLTTFSISRTELHQTVVYRRKGLLCRLR
jgi:hypothetical protein